MKFSASTLSLEHRLAYRFSMLAAQVTRCTSDLYRKHGLSIGGWRTLSIIGRYEPIHPSGIAARTSVDADKVTRAVDRLVANGLVARKTDPSDRRRIVITLTARGRRVHSEIDHIRRVTEEKLQSVLTQDEVARFYAALAKLEAQALRIFPTRGAWRSLVEGTKGSQPEKPGRARRIKAAAAR